MDFLRQKFNFLQSPMLLTQKIVHSVQSLCNMTSSTLNYNTPSNTPSNVKPQLQCLNVAIFGRHSKEVSKSVDHERIKNFISNNLDYQDFIMNLLYVSLDHYEYDSETFVFNYDSEEDLTNFLKTQNLDIAIFDRYSLASNVLQFIKLFHKYSNPNAKIISLNLDLESLNLDSNEFDTDMLEDEEYMKNIDSMLSPLPSYYKDLGIKENCIKITHKSEKSRKTKTYKLYYGSYDIPMATEQVKQYLRPLFQPRNIDIYLALSKLMKVNYNCLRIRYHQDELMLMPKNNNIISDKNHTYTCERIFSNTSYILDNKTKMYINYLYKGIGYLHEYPIYLKDYFRRNNITTVFYKKSF